MAKILIVDDHPLYREGVIAALSGHPLRAAVVAVSCAAEAVRALDEDPTVELALVDRTLHGEDGLQVLAHIGRRHPGVARMLISADDSAQLVRAAMAAGAQGFLPKSSSIAQMLAAIRRVLEGETSWPEAASFEPRHRPPSLASSRPASMLLTARQGEVLQLLGRGRSNAQIAAALGISERTVKAHFKGIFEALGVHTRVQALVQAKNQGLIG